MTLGDYYKLKHGAGATPANVLNNVHRKAISRLNGNSSTMQCQKLQDYFNRVFYPEVYGGGEDTTTLNRRINTLIQQAYQKKYDAALNGFSMGASKVTYGVKDMPGIIRDKYEDFDHKQRIYYTTIEQRLEKTKRALENIPLNTQGAEQLDRLKEELNILKKSLKELLKLKTGEDDKYLNLTNNPDLLGEVKKIDAMYQTLSHVDGVFQSGDYGQILEWVLQAFSAESEPIIDDISDNLLSDLMLEKMTKTAGSSTTGGRGHEDLIRVKTSDMTIDGKDVKTFKKKNSKGKEETYVSVGKGKGKFEFKYVREFNPDSDRPGKMDVNFHFNNEGKIIPFRISAKNWDVLSGRDFGDSAIAFALLRTVGNDTTTGYIYTMGDKDAIPAWSRDYHKVAQYALLLDILMGYSQANNYADTIFINVRSEKRVIVASITDILNRINDDIDSWEIGSDYKKRAIESNLQSIRKTISKRKIENKSHEVEALSLKYLQATRVKLMYMSIQKYISTQPTLPVAF